MSRATLLLRLLADAPLRAQRLSELVERSGLHKATVHRILGALVSERLVEVQGGGYSLGLEAWRIGQAAIKRFDLNEVARPCLEQIAAQTGDVGQLCVMAGGRVHCVGRVEGDHPILPTSLRTGMTRPLGCGVHGLALLSVLAPEQIRRVIEEDGAERAAFPQLTPDYLRRKVSETHSQGFAITDGDVVCGMTALAVVAFDPWQRPLASLACVAIAGRLEGQRREDVVSLLREQAARLEILYRTRLRSEGDDRRDPGR